MKLNSSALVCKASYALSLVSLLANINDVHSQNTLPVYFAEHPTACTSIGADWLEIPNAAMCQEFQSDFALTGNGSGATFSTVNDNTKKNGCTIVSAPPPAGPVVEWNTGTGTTLLSGTTIQILSCYDPTTYTGPNAGGGGDPHFHLFHDKWITFQGLCDVVLSHSDTAADGLPLTMHGRLSAPSDQKPGEEYTFISEVALKIANDYLFELHSEKGLLTLNGEKFADIDTVLNEEANEDIVSAGDEFPFMLKKETKGQRKNQVEYTFGFANGSKVILRANVHFKMVFVEMHGHFGGDANMKGLLGRPDKKGLFGRDGSLLDEDDVDAYGQEWQVLASEEKLFANKERYPQHPNQCIIVDALVSNGPGVSAVGGDVQLRGSRRLLALENGQMVDAAVAAAEACGKLHGVRKQFCIDDVIATGNLELAEDPFYSD
jgi:hypothetical protein